MDGPTYREKYVSVVEMGLHAKCDRGGRRRGDGEGDGEGDGASKKVKMRIQSRQSRRKRVGEGFCGREQRCNYSAAKCGNIHRI